MRNYTELCGTIRNYAELCRKQRENAAEMLMIYRKINFYQPGGLR